jgi:D-alanyl-D-alanine endopeptidase (penicillin-binding protein 7)
MALLFPATYAINAQAKGHHAAVKKTTVKRERHAAAPRKSARNAKNVSQARTRVSQARARSSKHSRHALTAHRSRTKEFDSLADDARAHYSMQRVAQVRDSRKTWTFESSHRRPVTQFSDEVPRRHLHMLVDDELGNGDGASLYLRANSVLVMDQDTHQVLYSKNANEVLPIASITKLMTGLLVSEAHLPFDEMITITQDDVDTLKGTGSRLRVGATLTRGELMHLALMASENRAAHALARTYPGGSDAFVDLMNAKARALGMVSTHYAEPTGLSSQNHSTAEDLARLVSFAYNDQTLRSLTTSPDYYADVDNRMLRFNTTNRLLKNPEWNIGLQKTGFINEAGQCMVMQTRIAGRNLIMVLLDSSGHQGRIRDAEHVRRWIETTQLTGAGFKRTMASIQPSS